MKYLFFVYAFYVQSCIGQKSCIGQIDTVKTLFFYEDSLDIVECGGELTAHILFFVSDTTKPTLKKNQFFIATYCPDKSYFKKKYKYKITLSKNAEEIKPFLAISQSTRKKLYKFKNFYVAKNIELIFP